MEARWWLWPTLLSLDAPIVALVWQDFLARCYPSVLLPAGRVTLGLTVWAIYLADRLLDTQAALPNDGVPHFFYRQYRAFARVLLALVLAADVCAVVWLRPQVRASGWWAAACVALYLSVYPVRRWRSFLKPVAAAVLFTWGVFLVAATSLPGTLAGPAAVFFGLCLANIVRSGLMAGLIALVCVVFGRVPFFVAVAASGVLMAFRPRERVLWDAALLTPLLVVLWMRIG